MKKGLFLLMASIAIAVTSCKKDLVVNDVQASQSERVATNAATVLQPPAPKLSLSKTKSNYGALIDGSSSEDSYTFKNNVAGKLGVSCVRDKCLWPGSRKVPMLTSSYNILLNFTSTNPMPMKFRTDVIKLSKGFRK